MHYHSLVKDEMLMVEAQRNFKEAVNAFGINEVISCMDEQTFWKLYSWFKETFEHDFKRC